MSVDLFDIYEYRAALLVWQQENVGQTQQIYLANDSSALLQDMTEDILRYGNLLYNRFATTLDAVDLSDVQQHYASGEHLDNRWNHENLQKLLRDLIQEKQDSLAQYGRYQSVLGEWHDMMAWLNMLLPGKNHVLISIEDSVPNFVRRLFEKYFDHATIYQRNQSPQDVAWLGKLALLHLGGAWWEQPDGLHFLHQLVEEHNELFGFY
jgi:hypothetical protein